MALSNSDRQQRFRESRLGLGGKYERLNCFVFTSTKQSLERLAFRFGCNITEMIERLINDKAAEVLDKLEGVDQHNFLARGAITEDV
jgi:hypothetical protein